MAKVNDENSFAEEAKSAADGPVPAMPNGFRLPRTLRLAHDLEFAAVYGARLKKTGVFIDVRAVPNRLTHWRLGLAVSKRVGNAAVRVRWKRLLREAFRHVRPKLPMFININNLERPGLSGMDLVVAVRAAGKGELHVIQAELTSLCVQLHREQQRRDRRGAEEVRAFPPAQGGADQR